MPFMLFCTGGLGEFGEKSKSCQSRRQLCRGMREMRPPKTFDDRGPKRHLREPIANSDPQLLLMR